MEGYIKNSNKYSHLSSEERGEIEAYLHQGISISQIAIYLKRSKSKISDEEIHNIQDMINNRPMKSL